MQALWHVGPAVAYAALTFVGGSMRQAESGLPVGDKVIHTVSFGIMTWLGFRACRYLMTPLSPYWALGTAFGITVGMGALLEAWQAMLPYRTADWADWGADAAGAFAAGAVIAGALLVRRRLA